MIDGNMTRLGVGLVSLGPTISIIDDNNSEAIGHLLFVAITFVINS